MTPLCARDGQPMRTVTIRHQPAGVTTVHHVCPQCFGRRTAEQGPAGAPQLSIVRSAS